MGMDLSLDELKWVFVTLFELVKMKRGTHQSYGEIKGKGKHFAIMAVVSHLWTWHLSAFHSVNWVFNLFLSRSTFMSHATPLSLSKIALSVVTLCSASLSQCCQVFGRAALCSKGKLFWEFTPAVKTNFLSQLLLSQSYGYIILKIPELCSEFCVIDVGFIMPSFDETIPVDISSSSRN